MAASLKSRTFGLLLSEEYVEAWTLSGSGGLEFGAITQGGIITGLRARFGDVTGLSRKCCELSCNDSPNNTRPSYINLAGEPAGSIAGHELQIRSDEFVIISELPPGNHRWKSTPNKL